MLPLHPRMVHLPIALSVLMPLVTSGLLLAWWRGWFPRRTWAIAVALQLALVAGGWAAIQTGEVDGRRALTVVSEALVEEHEEAAEAMTVGALVVLLVAAAALLVRAERPARAVAAVAVAGTLAVLVLGYRAGEKGGRLAYVHGVAGLYRVPPGLAPMPAAEREDR